MSGAISASTIAALVGAGVGAVGTGVGIYQGVKASDAQNAALQKQKTAEQTATQNALSTERQGEIAQGAANQQKPDIVQILRRAAQAGMGPGATMLSGTGGTGTGTLGPGTTLLGS